MAEIAEEAAQEALNIDNYINTSLKRPNQAVDAHGKIRPRTISFRLPVETGFQI